MFVYLGLGSNLGDRAAHLRAGLVALEDVGAILAQSPVYRSAPMYITDQPEFLNMAALLETDLAPHDLLLACHAIEAREGRDRGPGATRNGPRQLDLDLLLALADLRPSDPAAAIRLALPDLTLPHPRLAERAFVLRPLCDIAPDLIDPRTGTRICDLAERVRDQDVYLVGDLAALA
jgi:2-amino-4-hydroxy-6-hydroxymethyldihydropteridine diphosphokinase